MYFYRILVPDHQEFICYHQTKWKREIFFSHIVKSYQEVIKEHPHRLSMILGKDKIAIPVEFVLHKLHHLFQYQPVTFTGNAIFTLENCFDPHFHCVLPHMLPPKIDNIQEDIPSFVISTSFFQSLQMVKEPPLFHHFDDLLQTI